MRRGDCGVWKHAAYAGQVDDDEDEAWQQRLEQRMFPLVKGWAKRTRTVPQTPAAGSSLAKDDTFFSPQPPSQLAYAGMVTATEHLDLFRIAFLASRALYPSAYFTLLRSALMGSAQAIWVLRASPRTKRVENALRLVRDDLKQRKGMLQEPPATIDLDADEFEGERDNLAEWLVWVQDAAERIELDRSAVPRWQLSMTDVIKKAGELVHHGGEDDAEIQYGTLLLWRMQSGHAHGTPSARLTQIKPEEIIQRSDGTNWAKATTSMADVGAAASAAVMLLAEAWKTYDTRCRPACPGDR